MYLGRPKIELDFNQFEKLMALQCTLAEVAGWFRCSEDTIERRCLEHYGINFAELLKRHGAGAKISLRRAQYKKALEGNVPMLIWLGKQWLSQQDKIEPLFEDKIKPIRLAYDTKRLGQEENNPSNREILSHRSV